MNATIIEVIDHLATKMGLVIDWAADNVYPQVLEVMARCRVYEMVSNALGALLCIGYLFCVVVTIKRRVIPAYKLCAETGEENFWWSECYGVSPNLGGLITMAIAGIVAAGVLVECLGCITDLMRWAIIPEMQFYKLIVGGCNG